MTSCRNDNYIDEYFNNMTLEDLENYCEKFYLHESNEDKMSVVYKSNKHKLTKRERDIKHKNNLHKLSMVKSYPPPVTVMSDENNVKYYKRLYRDNHNGGRFKYYKKYSNRKVRRYKNQLSNGGYYKKIFDYWWETT